MGEVRTPATGEGRKNWEPRPPKPSAAAVEAVMGLRALGPCDARIVYTYDGGRRTTIRLMPWVIDTLKEAADVLGTDVAGLVQVIGQKRRHLRLTQAAELFAHRWAQGAWDAGD